MHVLNATDGMVPSDMSLKSSEGLEEERRVFYVALTRAESPSTFITRCGITTVPEVETIPMGGLSRHDSCLLRFDRGLTKWRSSTSSPRGRRTRRGGWLQQSRHRSRITLVVVTSSVADITSETVPESGSCCVML